MVKKIVGGVVAIVAILLLVVLLIAAMKPDKFHVERSTTIAAPSTVVFPHINNLQKFHRWNPWAKLDPQAKNEWTGPEEGEGAIFSWKGDATGSGRMTLEESSPDKAIRFKLDFLEPMQMTSSANFTLTPDGESTKVTWAMDGESPYMHKVFQVFMSIETIVGGQFEAGLADLKKIAESPPPHATTTTSETPHEGATIPPELPGEQPSTSLPQDLPPPTDTGGEQPRVK